MNIQRVNLPSFCGIKKVVSMVSPAQLKDYISSQDDISQKACSTLNADTFVPSQKENHEELIKMTQFFNNNRLVGTHYDFANGGYVGERTFADGTQISYSATKLGENFFVAGTSVKNPQKGLIGGHISHDAYDKKGRPAIPTLKFIQEHSTEKGIEKLIREGKLIDITNEVL
ncbi:hypothetical protein IJS77_00140 [bacterium]|nr:hypothetical protein [bacterium]